MGNRGRWLLFLSGRTVARRRSIYILTQAMIARFFLVTWPTQLDRGLFSSLKAGESTLSATTVKRSGTTQISLHFFRSFNAKEAKAVLEDLYDASREHDPFCFPLRADDPVFVIERVPGLGKLEKIETEIVRRKIVQ